MRVSPGHQDTTELDFNGQAIAGLGPLSYEAQRGMYLHPTFAVTPARAKTAPMISAPTKRRGSGRR